MKRTSTLSATVLFASLSATPVFADSTTISKFIKDSVVEGAIEIEAGFSNNASSDITAATVELVIDSKINETVSSHILLLHEEDDTPLEVDEASISMDMGDGFTLTAGQLYLPFGNHETNMISDSLPHELSETRETAIQLDYESNATTSSFYLFYGDVLKNAEQDAIASMGLNIAYATDDVTIGFSYINNLTEGDLITDTVITNTKPTVVLNVSAMSVYANTAFGDTSIFFEYISAIDEFDSADLVFNAAGAKPTAINLEAGFNMNDAVVAIGFQSSSEALGLGLPETRVLVSYSTEILKDTSLAFEIASDQDYSTADGGSGDKTSSATVQLAVAF